MRTVPLREGTAQKSGYASGTLKNFLSSKEKTPTLSGWGFRRVALLVEAHNLEILGELWVKASLVCFWELGDEFLGVYALANS